MDKSEKNLERLKRDYEVLKKKHDLPNFKEINEAFQIEKLTELETENLLREIRKLAGDKIANCMKFIETLLNPVNAQMFVFSLVKALDSEDKKMLSEIYKDMMKTELSFIELEFNTDDAKESKFIKDSFKFWQSVKKDMFGLMQKIGKKWDEKSENKNNGYFG